MIGHYKNKSMDQFKYCCFSAFDVIEVHNFFALGSMTFTECNKLYYDEKRRLGSSELTMNTICNSKRVQMSTVRHAASISKMVDIKFGHRKDDASREVHH